MSIVDLKYDYQKEMYAEIKSLIDSGETSLCYVLCMGLGKSYIFLKILEDYFVGKRILYISPKHAINDALKNKPEFKELQKRMSIDMVTFKSFNKERPEYREYDGVFVDECHHCISPIQGKNLMSHNEYVSHTLGKYMIGFSATPIFKSPYTRGTVDIRNMFHASVTGISIAEAIRRGIVQKIRYAIAVPDTDIDRLLDDSEISPENFRAKYSIDSTKSMLKNIATENSDIRHWIAFFTNQQIMFESVQQLKEIFPGYTIYEMYSGMTKEPGAVLEQFDSDQGNAILASVDMLLEGVHPKTAEGVLLYRNSNETVFTQILGRLMDIDYNDRQPIFVDVTNVASKLDLRGMLEYVDDSDCQETESPSDPKSRESGMRSLKDIIDVHCSMYRYVQMLEDLLSMTSNEIHVIVDDTEIIFTSYADLARQLGLKDGGTRIKIKRNAGESWEDICRYYIDKHAPKPEKSCTIDGHDIKWKTDSELVRRLNDLYSLNLGLQQVQGFLERGRSPKEIIQIVTSREPQTINFNNRQIKYTSVSDLSRKLGKNEKYVSDRLKKGQTLEEIITEIENGGTKLVVDGVEYVYTSAAGLGKLLGLSNSSILKYRKDGMSDEEIVRMVMSKSVTVGNRVIPYKNNVDLSLKLGKKKSWVNDKLKYGKSIQQIAEEALLDTPLYTHSVVVDGETFNFNTNKELSLALGRGENHVARKRSEGLSYEEIIRRSLNQ